MANKGYNQKTAQKWSFIGFFFGIIGFLIALTKPKYTNQIITEPVQDTLPDGRWKCVNCGTKNYSHAKTCISCGSPKQKTEEQELAQLKKIAEYKQLLDTGVITPEYFEEKKQQILNNKT